MPKYVFELSLSLVAGDTLDVDALNAISSDLADHLEVLAVRIGKRVGRIATEAPFEQVTGDFEPPDENGVIRLSPVSRPIDYQPETQPPRGAPSQ